MNPRFAVVFRRAILALILALVLGAAFAQPRIVVSIHPYFDLVQRIAGPEATVVRLLPPGASPHGFDPTPSAVAELERADLVILNGGLDAWVLDMVPTGRQAPAVLEILPLFDGLDRLLPAVDGDGNEDAHNHEHGEDEHGHEDDAAEHDDDHAHEDEGSEHDEDHAEEEEGVHGHAHEGVNPHVWLDPVLVEQAVGAIAVRLGDLDPERAETYRQNGAELTTALRSLHGELQLVMAPVRGAPFIPFHDAWPYFAARYDLDLVAEIEPFPGREPGPRYLAEVVDLLRSSGASAIFAEAQLGDRAARVIAAEAGVAVAVLDPIGGVEGRMSFEELLRYNAHTIVDALDGR